MTSEKKCCVPFCDSQQQTLHKFPNPDKDPDRFRTWLYKIGGDILSLQNAIIFKRRRVCNLHFETKFHTRSKLLSPAAVPTLNLSETCNTAVASLSAQDASLSAQEVSLSAQDVSLSAQDVSLSAQEVSLSAQDVSLSAQEVSLSAQDVSLSAHDAAFSAQSSPAFEREAERGPFSWQQEVAVVPCDDIEYDTEVLDEEIFSEEPHSAASDDESSQQPEELHEGFKCNVCCSDIIGLRYACVQCADYDLCGACEARGAHPAHYVLRVPPGRPPGEVLCKLQTIRRALLSDAIVHVQGDLEQPMEIKEEEDDPIDAEPSEPTLRPQSDCDKKPTTDLPDPLDTAARSCDVTDVDSDSTMVDRSHQPHSGGSSDDECAPRGPSAATTRPSHSVTSPPHRTNVTPTPDSKTVFVPRLQPINSSSCATHQLHNQNTQKFTLLVEKVEPNTYSRQPVGKRVFDIGCLPETVRKKLRIVRISSSLTEQSMEKDPSIPAQKQCTKEARVCIQKLGAAEMSAATHNS